MFILRMVQNILQERLPRCLFLWLDFYWAFVLRWLLFLLRFFFFFFRFCLFDGVHHQYSEALVILIFFKEFWYFPDLIVLFLPLFLLSTFFLSVWHFSITNSIPISWQYILIVCIRVGSFCFFLISSKYLDIFIYIYIYIYIYIKLFTFYCDFYPLCIY